MKSFFISTLEVIKVVVIAVGTVYLVRTFLVQPFLVSGSSMVPNFHGGDYLLIDELTYRFRKPERGEVVVFHSPGDPSVFFIKRVIGLPGEKIEIRNGRVFVVNQGHPEGVMLDESYLPENLVTSGGIVMLAEDQYFVMGDNRLHSLDSRRWGPLSAESIVGLVRLRLWPIGSAQAFGIPQYGESSL